MSVKFNLILICLSLVLAVSLIPGSGDSPKAAGMNAISSGYDVIGAINSLRSSNGLPAYKISSILMDVAQTQANYLASTGGVNGHIGPGGSHPIDRVRAAGYPLAGGFISENWQAGQGLDASGAVDAWMGDAPHRGTMLSADLTQVGAGAATKGDVNYYVVDAAQPTGAIITYVTPIGGGTQLAVSGTPASQEPTISMVIASTPDKNGNTYYLVQPGQTLSQIGSAYKMSVDQIKLLNNLSSDLIYSGQKLFIKRGATITPTVPSATSTREQETFTPLPTFEIFTPTLTQTDTPVPVAPISAPMGAGGAVGAIIVVALAAAALVAWAGRSRPL